ncbi:52 kDa repressor of the inhibitor of the protein kinase-like [Aphis craccivora]|uniref:52 kDa repressor of the inhibitor of the protein kinase-like n=1 Tax=Aphis craccivora TaxID=307492 RepID=A0A6G0ZFK4_APHCR|nr:52 kDa repressor of the inhibitor of the protein kinase-like [Aphis craccivora]
MKRLKTYLRNSMKESRLNGLIKNYIHNNIRLIVEEIIDEIAKKPRRLQFVL